MSGPGVAVSTSAAAANRMSVEKSGIVIPLKVRPEFLSSIILGNGNTEVYR